MTPPQGTKMFLLQTRRAKHGVAEVQALVGVHLLAMRTRNRRAKRCELAVAQLAKEHVTALLAVFSSRSAVIQSGPQWAVAGRLADLR